jgi:L-alanine-DL-glutamate epimerase-like enolase superfamily enzyme
LAIEEPALNRRTFLGAMSATLLADSTEKKVVPWYEEPMLDLHSKVKAPVKIRSIELLQAGKDFFVRTRSTDGVEGLIRTKQMDDFIPIFHNRVVPAFLGKDARDIETLIDDVYTQNYKMAGQAFWCPVAYVEQSIFDLLGKSSGKRVAELFGGVVREEIPVYLSGSARDLSAEKEVDLYVRGLEETGAKAVKFKIGGRMSRNLDAYPGRTETMMTLARKRMGDDIVINADANGSYNAKKAIEVGRMLEDLNCNFFEEPCPWQEIGETKKVADALEIPIAIGEQDSNLWLFEWFAENKVAQILQPDINYNGGFVRTLRVARIAKKFHLPIVPHNTQTGSTAVNILNFAAAVESIGGYMEYPHRGKPKPEPFSSPQFQIKNGTVSAPKGSGLGVTFDPAFIKKASLIKA